MNSQHLGQKQEAQREILGVTIIWLGGHRPMGINMGTLRLCWLLLHSFIFSLFLFFFFLKGLGTMLYLRILRQGSMGLGQSGCIFPRPASPWLWHEMALI